MNMRQQCAVEAKKANGIRGRKWKPVILPFYWTLVRPALECWVLFWTPQFKDDVDILERVQQRPTVMKGWKNLSYEERPFLLRKMSMFRTEKKRLRGMY